MLLLTIRTPEDLGRGLLLLRLVQVNASELG